MVAPKTERKGKGRPKVKRMVVGESHLPKYVPRAQAQLGGIEVVNHVHYVGNLGAIAGNL